MDIYNLRAFLAVATSGSFSRAKEQLCLTQPAVSKRINALERQLGTRLFDRVGRRVALTEAGHILLPRARRILAEVEESRRALADLSGRVAGRLTIGTSHHIGLHRLPPVLRRYSHRYPEVELDLHFMGSEAACRAVERGELELAIVTLPLASPPQLHLTPVWDDPLSIMVARDHPLATADEPTPETLARHSAILPSRGTYTRELLERAMAPLGVELKTGLSTNYLETIKMLVSVGLGWGLLPRTMLEGGLIPLTVPPFRLRRTLGVVRHTARTQTNAGRALLVLLGELGDGRYDTAPDGGDSGQGANPSLTAGRDPS